MGGPVKHINSPHELKALLETTQYVIADFYADWCPPCKAIAPKYEELATQHSIPEFLAFAKINVDRVPALAQEHKITSMPSFTFFKDAKRVRVNGDLKIEGADYMRLRDAAAKVSKLAQDKADAAEDLKR